MSLTIACAPLHAPSVRQNPQALVRQIRSLGADSIGGTEWYPVVSYVDAHMPGYRMVLEEGGRDQRRGQKDTPILVRKKNADGERRVSMGSGQLWGAGASTPTRLAPDRFMTFSVTMEDRGPHCHTNLHPHPAVQDRATGRWNEGAGAEDRVEKFRGNMRRLDEWCSFVAGCDWDHTVTGDLNSWDRFPANTRESPYRVLRRHGLTIHDSGIIVIASDMRLDVNERKVPAKISDHVWLVGRRG